jgi:hypothetical protein
MAEIVLGVGTTHGPLLSTPPEAWDGRAAVDRANPELCYREGTYDFQQLYELRKDPYFAEQNKLAVRTERYNRCQKALDQLGETFKKVQPDVVVIVGDDQREWFQEETQPSFAVYCGDQVINYAIDDPAGEGRGDRGLTHAVLQYHPTGKDVTYDVPGALSRHMVRSANDDEFDVAFLGEQPKGKEGPRNVGHAYGYVAMRLLKDRVPPMVPVLANTYYPPNQPTPKRCYEFGKSLGRAIRSWDQDLRVAVCASGGMSHFVLDEEFDHRMINALRDRDEKTLFAEPNIHFRSGTSEVKNWIIMAGALAGGTDFEMDLLDYVPCYRSEAGTGSGMAFAVWQ